MWLVVLGVGAASLVPGARPALRPLASRRVSANALRADLIEQTLAEQLAAVRALRPNDPPGAADSAEIQASLWEAAGLNPVYKVSGIRSGEPSFTSLFTHDTWRDYTGIAPFRRWVRTVTTWRWSTVLAALWPTCLFVTLWAYVVASLPTSLIPRTSPVPLTLMGSAIGLLLVFRTNNT